ncbi:MAG: M48 family metalloprotease [Desulfobacterales bacterium]|nr:M48 family metalloprotease [Desulfobacterales bacterium]
MFSNFFYIIIALMIYYTHQPSETGDVEFVNHLGLTVGIFLLFLGFTWAIFRKMQTMILQKKFKNPDPFFQNSVSWLMIISLLLFALYIYVFNLKALFVNLFLFKAFPSLLAFLFMLVFFAHLLFIWLFSHKTYQILYRTQIKRTIYLYTHLAFTIPALIPWLILSVFTDVISNIPSPQLQAFLEQPIGEFSVFATLFLFLIIIGPGLIQKLWGCKPLERGFARDQIEYICEKANLSYRNIVKWPVFGGMMITAGVMGIVKWFRYILVTSAMLEFLSPEEIDSVIAHEIGHVKKKHLILYILFFLVYMLLAYLLIPHLVMLVILIKPIYFLIQDSQFDRMNTISAIFGLTVILCFLVYFRYIFGYFMRNFERQADMYVYELIGHAQSLISTFNKIILTSGQNPDKPDWHHFSISERMDYLKKCEDNPLWISKHETKLRLSLIMYALSTVFLLTIGYMVNYGNLSESFDIYTMKKELFLLSEKKGVDNSNLFAIMGNFYYSLKQYDKAIQAYENSLALKPNEPEVLNNLAWLLATSSTEDQKQKKRAVELAEKAVVIDRSPHILDTLAESYYAAGMIEKAIEIQQEAIAIVKENKEYYEQQLKKFIQAKG